MPIPVPAFAESTAALSPELVQRLSSPGCQCIRLEWTADLDAFAVPANNNRVYLAFSLVRGSSTVIVTPSSDVGGAGYVLDPNGRTVEFAGHVLNPLVTCEWRCTAFAFDAVNIIVVNRE